MVLMSEADLVPVPEPDRVPEPDWVPEWVPELVP